VLDGVFGPVTAIGDGFVAQRRNCLAAGAALTPDRLSGLREIIWHQLSLLPAADGAGIVAAPGVIAGKDRHLEWWQRTDGGTDGFARIRLNLDPESIDLYDYLDMDWFTIPRRAGRPYVYGPHIDFSCADRYVVTMTVPVTDASSPNHGAAGEREFLGVAGADIRMSYLEPELLAILRSVPAPAVLVTAERRVVAANTPHWISGTRLRRLPAAGDGDFAAVKEIGADSGWRLAAATAPARDRAHSLLLSDDRQAHPKDVGYAGPLTGVTRPPPYTVDRPGQGPFPTSGCPATRHPSAAGSPTPAGRPANRRRRPYAHRGGLQRLRADAEAADDACPGQAVTILD
jgi:hypothetical protein